MGKIKRSFLSLGLHNNQIELNQLFLTASFFYGSTQILLTLSVIPF